jgi:hypothetical protein
MVKWQMNRDLERIWKEVIVASSRYYPSIRLEEQSSGASISKITISLVSSFSSVLSQSSFTPSLLHLLLSLPSTFIVFSVSFSSLFSYLSLFLTHASDVRILLPFCKYRDVLLKARNVKPAETAVDWERLCKHDRCLATISCNKQK